MTDPDEEPIVRDNSGRHCFEVEQGGERAELVYRTEPGRLILVHTEVPDVLAGRGIGGQLVRAAVARATAEQLTVVPLCPFASQWLHGHPDLAGTATIDWVTQPPTE